MSKTVPAQKVTDFLRFLVEFTKDLKVNKYGTIVLPNEDDPDVPFTASHDGKPHPIRIFQDPVPKGTFWLLNPFTNTLRTTPELGKFYRCLLHPLNIQLLSSMQVAIRVLLKQKDIETDGPSLDNLEIDDQSLSLFTGEIERKRTLIDEVDEKMLGELNSLMNKKEVFRQLIVLNYSSANISCHVTVPALKVGPNWFEEESGVKLRKKTSLTLFRLLRNFLGAETVDDLKQFNATAGEGESPRFSAWIRCYTKLYGALSKPFDILTPGKIGDLENLENWLEFLPAMSSRAKFITGGLQDTQEIVNTSTKVSLEPVEKAKTSVRRSSSGLPRINVEETRSTPKLFADKSSSGPRMPGSSRQSDEPRLFSRDLSDYRRTERRSDRDRDYDREPTLFSRRGSSASSSGPRMPRF